MTDKKQKAIEALKEYDEARCAVILLNSEISEAKKKVTPVEVQRALEEVDEEFRSVLELANSQMEEKKKAAQDAIVNYGESVKIPDIVSGTFVRGSITVSSKFRTQFEKKIETDPELKPMFNFGANYARIK